MASSISSTQSSAVSQLSQVESRPAPSSEPEPNEPARPQLGSAAQNLTAPPSDSGRGRNVDVVA
ncbi:MAG: hypothetical protein NBV67_08855 [Tagaea sp.]|nr:hypothetical protein [Tagaea sp.]